MLEPRRLRNKCRRGGGFAFYVDDVRRVVAAARRAGRAVVGTFHSHPLGLAVPGESDIAHASVGELMLVFDCLDRKAALWRIGRTSAKRVRLRPVGAGR